MLNTIPKAGSLSTARCVSATTLPSKGDRRIPGEEAVKFPPTYGKRRRNLIKLW